MQKWEYFPGNCIWGTGKEWGVEQGKAGEWFLWTGENGKGPKQNGWQLLHEGLNYLGEQGFELVAIQINTHAHGGLSSQASNPQSKYIFKRPRP